MRKDMSNYQATYFYAQNLTLEDRLKNIGNYLNNI